MELLIKNGEIIDGTGKTGYISDLLISDGVIKQIDKSIKLSTTLDKLVKIIDASGLIVAPGFIDMHAHSDATFTCEITNEEKLQQGVTTQVNGNCGFGLFPMSNNSELISEVVEDLKSVEFYLNEKDIKWGNFEEFTSHFNINFGTNHVPLVPHSLIRTSVKGYGDKEVTEIELEAMKKILEEQLSQGAWGMSTGLAYAPGCFSKTSELIYLCKVLKQMDKVYFTHMRDEGDLVIDSVLEVIEIAEKSGCKAHISHLKAMGVKNHSKTDEIIHNIKLARSRGVNITADIYPYEASSTMLSILLPKETRINSIDKLLENLKEDNFKNKIRKVVEYNLENRGGSEKIIINFVGNSEYNYIIGKTLKEIAEALGLDEIETVFKLIVENKNIVNGIFFAISESGIEKFLKEDFISIGSDGMLNVENKKASHPRTYGTFPKIYSKYVREKEVITFEKAVHKMTKLPATILGLQNRGELVVGNIGDVTIFDKNKIKDNSTFENSFSYPSGINYVIVGGTIALENGKISSELSGKILKQK